MDTQDNLLHLYEDSYEINKEQKALNLRKKAYEEATNKFITSYFTAFGVKNIHYLPLNAKSFISHPKFEFKKSESGDVYWIARGTRISIKDGKQIYGTAQDELWQAQFENMSASLKAMTIDEACEKSTPIFKISPSTFKGCNYAAPAYILHEMDNWQLVWRKGASAYIDRFTKSLTASAGLQLLYTGESEQKDWQKIRPLVEKVTGQSIPYAPRSVDITTGGRLSKGLIEKEAQRIDALCGDGVANAIIAKMQLQSEDKKEIRKQLKP